MAGFMVGEAWTSSFFAEAGAANRLQPEKKGTQGVV